jgi:menaquinone-dependent protoporphyrinogen oxidase
VTNILVLYATIEGQTAKISKHIADTIRAKGFKVDVIDVKEVAPNFSLAKYEAAIVGGSIHTAKHQKYLTSFVKNNRFVLREMPSAFFSVSVSAASFNAKNRALADEYLAKFVQESGWQPSKVALIGGALRYSKYNFLTKFLLKQMTKRSVGPTDTWRDYEFTEWEAVTQFAEEFLASLPVSAAKS